MHQRLAIVVTILLVLGVLIALNAATYVRVEEQPDSEIKPNRSSYNAGPTGTRALYDLLSESGYKVVRWRELTARLTGDSNGTKIKTFVVIGRTTLPFDESDKKSLLLWVKRGGRLVIIDRGPERDLLPASGDWSITTELLDYPRNNSNPANPEEMTEGVQPAYPAQPTVLTRGVESVMPSRFASIIKFSTSKKGKPPGRSEKQEQEHELSNETEEPVDGEPSPAPSPPTGVKTSATVNSLAPVVHLHDLRGILLLDYSYDQGRIIVLSDPYIVSNAGINRADNLQLAINILTGGGGLIAFDEYHQGHGTTRNALVGYFAGTPVLAIFGQLILIVLVILWTRGRRFARPLPLPQVDRRSSLEFVASMAELQQRARAFDLAIENIYSRTRRVLARYAGVDYNSPRSEIALRVAARSSLDREQLETLMRHCEETINGTPVNERQSVHLARRLREVERALGLRMRSRDVKQASNK